MSRAAASAFALAHLRSCTSSSCNCILSSSAFFKISPQHGTRHFPTTLCLPTWSHQKRFDSCGQNRRATNRKVIFGFRKFWKMETLAPQSAPSNHPPTAIDLPSAGRFSLSVAAQKQRQKRKAAGLHDMHYMYESRARCRVRSCCRARQASSDERRGDRSVGGPEMARPHPGPHRSCSSPRAAAISHQCFTHTVPCQTHSLLIIASSYLAPRSTDGSGRDDACATWDARPYHSSTGLGCMSLTSRGSSTFSATPFLAFAKQGGGNPIKLDIVGAHEHVAQDVQRAGRWRYVEIHRLEDLPPSLIM